MHDHVQESYLAFKREFYRVSYKIATDLNKLR
jgi:hypothetical protein